MLYAVLGTLREVGDWAADAVILPIEPKRVSSFLLEGGQEDAPYGKEKGSRGKMENKKQKIDLLGNWLLDDQTVVMGNSTTEATREAFLQRWSPKQKGVQNSRKAIGIKGGDEGMKKLDDVTDSLLQGVAWLRWQENRSQLLEACQEGRTISDA
jgi:cruciform cutting endonuclease 1